MSKSIYDFPPDVQRTVCDILAKAAERKAQAAKTKGA